MSNEKKIYDIAIIGAGPAGISCAVQLKRFGFDPLIIEKEQVGGLLKNANLVENCPGFPEGIKGINLIEKMALQLDKHSIKPLIEEVCAVNYDEYFTILTGESVYKSKILIVATGTEPKIPEIRIPFELADKNYYEVSDLYKNDLCGKTVAIIGSGDAAFDYALNLSENSQVKKILILNRSANTKCLDLLKNRALGKSNIEYMENYDPGKIINDSGKTSLFSNSKEVLKTDYILWAIGRIPCLGFFSLPMLDIIENLKNKNKLFFIGDVKNDLFRQAAIASGDGLKTAMKIYRFQ